ncbi:MAG: DUF3037 domain-containing protein [Nocardioides sp.]
MLRCVPRADREEFVNVGVVLYCQATDFLEVATLVDEQRLSALDAQLDVAQVRAALAFAGQVCRGEERRAAEQSLGTRFGFLAAPRARWSGPDRCTSRRRPGPAAGAIAGRAGGLSRLSPDRDQLHGADGMPRQDRAGDLRVSTERPETATAPASSAGSAERSCR